MKTVTEAQIIKWKPCYKPDKVHDTLAGRARWTYEQIAELDIPVSDRLWVLIRMLPSRRHRVAWACDCAERALSRYESRHPGDARPREAIRVTRAWLRGEATIGEVRAYAAASYAAYAAAADAASYAAYYAAYAHANAASYAADADASYAADAAERTWQLARILAYLRGGVTP
jgi:hypothetical protein